MADGFPTGLPRVQRIDLYNQLRRDAGLPEEISTETIERVAAKYRGHLPGDEPIAILWAFMRPDADDPGSMLLGILANLRIDPTWARDRIGSASR